MSRATPESAVSASRLDRIDALRGAAMLWMAAYHLDFDLNHFGFLEPRHRFFTDAFWVVQRTGILSLFLFTAGFALAVGASRGRTSARFWQRWLRVVGAAVLVSLATWWMFPDRWVWFGVLHALSLMLVFAWGLVMLRMRPWMVALAAVALFALPYVASGKSFDAPWLQWLGLGTFKPRTQDWVPLAPWFGVMLAGLAVGQHATAKPGTWLHRLAHKPLGTAWQPLVAMGRWSLSFYLLHQPIFFGLVAAAAWLRR
jgi:uncharacterized membrane protein